MNNKYFAFIFASLLLHLTFITLSYSSAFLSGLGNFVDPIIIARTFMLLQFLPLLTVVNAKKLSERKSLLFFTFAICLSTLYIVDDFNMGFYGAVVDYQTGIVPRMRASAHLMGYKDSGTLVVLDFHGEYFLEFVLVHFISEITGLNYVFTYFFYNKSSNDSDVVSYFCLVEYFSEWFQTQIVNSFACILNYVSEPRLQL